MRQQILNQKIIFENIIASQAYHNYVMNFQNNYTEVNTAANPDVVVQSMREINESVSNVTYPDYFLSMYLPIITNFNNIFSQYTDHEYLPEQQKSVFQNWLNENWIIKSFPSLFSVFDIYNALFAKQIGQELKKTQEEAKELLKELKLKVTDRVADQYIVEYTEAAEGNKKDANRWLIVAVVAGIALITFFTIFYQMFPELDLSSATNKPNEQVERIYKAYNAQLTNYLITKVVVISLLIFMLTWALKQYKIHKHLQTMHLNKKVALKSFTNFLNAINNPDKQDQIRVEISKVIFGPASSGYFDGKDQDGPTIFNSIGNLKGES